MAKNKQKPEEIDLRRIDSIVENLCCCAHCLDGEQNKSCKHTDKCDEYVMNTLTRALDITAKLQEGCADKVLKTIRSKVNGFRCQNILTGKFKGKVARSLAESAMDLRYTADVVAGRDSVPENPEAAEVEGKR